MGGRIISTLLILYIHVHGPYYIRPAEFFEGFWFQTPPLSLTQNLTAFQFLGPYDTILPLTESFEVGNFKANLR